MLALTSVLFVVLGSVAGAAALGSRRTDVVLGFSILAATIVVVPIHALGLLDILTPFTALVGPAVLGAGVLAGALAHLGRERARSDLARAGRILALAPATALRVTLRARSVAALTVAAAYGVVGYALVVGWLVPSDAWDGIWYHDTMVGAALQSHGYAPMALPPNLIQQANGFPRGAEATSLYLTCLVDRRIIEWTSTLSALPLFAATYGVTRRFARARALALGLAGLAVLVPALAVQLRSTYVDVYAAAWLVAGTHYALARRPGGRSTLMAALAIALLLGAKTSALATAPTILGVACVRLWRARGVEAAAPLTAGLALVGASCSTTYLRNAIVFHNPLWPYAVRSPRLRLDWPGVVAVAESNQNASLGETLRAVFAPHVPGRDYADVRIGGYGEAVAWVLLPLAAAGLVLAARDAAVSWRRGVRGRPSLRPATAIWLALGGPVLGAVTSPAIWAARYHLALVALLAAPAAYLLSALRRSRLGELSLAAATGLSILHLCRLSPPLAGVVPQEAARYAAMTPSERAERAPAPWSLDAAVARARDRELGPGTSVAFGDGVAFPSVLWNERFEGRLVYLPERAPAALDADVGRVLPTWLVAAPGEPLHVYASERSDTWQPIGMASRSPPTYAFRRLQGGPPTR